MPQTQPNFAAWVNWLVLPQPRPAGPRWERYKVLIVQRDGHRCRSCSNPVDFDPALATQTLRAHIDHIVPFSLGGSNDGRNLQTLCDRCNLSKGDRRVRGQSDGELSRHELFRRWYEPRALQHGWAQTHGDFLRGSAGQPALSYEWLHRVGWAQVALSEFVRNYPTGSRSFEAPPR